VIGHPIGNRTAAQTQTSVDVGHKVEVSPLSQLQIDKSPAAHDEPGNLFLEGIVIQVTWIIKDGSWLVDEDIGHR